MSTALSGATDGGYYMVTGLDSGGAKEINALIAASGAPQFVVDIKDSNPNRMPPPFARGIASKGLRRVVSLEDEAGGSGLLDLLGFGAEGPKAATMVLPRPIELGGGGGGSKCQ